MFDIKYTKTQECCFRELNLSFLYDLHHGEVSNEYQDIETQNAPIGGLWGDFATIFWIIKYIQWPIYVWNKYSNGIMCNCGLDYQMDTLPHCL